MKLKPTEKIHDRIAEVHPLQREGLVVDVVQDPYDRTQNISVVKSTRDDPIAGMLARGQIDLAQMQAGRIWQKFWEDAEGGVLRGIDPTREPVDGKGPAISPFTDKRAHACEELRNARIMLGWEGDCIVRGVLSERLQIHQVAIRHGRPAKYMGQRFKECLETLAKLWGLA